MFRIPGPFKSYKISSRKVKVNGVEYDAAFPEKHSRIKGVVVNGTSGKVDSQHNTARYMDGWLKVLVMRKGERKWEEIYDGSYNASPQNYRAIFPLLYELEDKKTKKEFVVGLLREQLKEAESELEKLSK